MSVGLLKRVSDDLVEAMKARREMELSAIRMLKAEFQRARAEAGRSSDLSDDECVAVVQRLIKQRKEAAEQFAAAGAKDRAEAETNEAVFLERYLPRQLSEEELTRIVESAAAGVKAVGPRDMGRVMGAVMNEVKGRADGKRVKAAVQEYFESLVS